MAIKEYKPGMAFPGRMGRTIEESEPAWPAPVRAKAGAPNVLFIVMDDTGFGQLGCYGGPINTPNINQLAKNGLLYTNMHTTALCSPTRSCILTGRNHHSNAMSCITEGLDRVSGRQRRDSVRERVPLRDPAAERLRHLLHRQVAPDAGRADQRRRPVRSLAARPRLRALLRLSRRRHASVLSRPRLRQPSGRAAEDAGTGLSPHRRSRRSGPSSSSPISSRSRPTSRSSCTSRPAPTTRRITCRRSGSTSTRASSTTAGTSIAGAHVREADRARHHAEGRRAVAARSGRPGLGQAPGRRAQTLRAHDGSVRGLLRAHGPPGRTTARVPEEHRTARQHADHADLRQRRQRRRRADRIGQREQVLQQRARRSPAEPRGDRRTRRAEVLQPLRLGLDVCGQHAVPALEARNLPRRRQRSVHRPLAQGHQGQGRDSARSSPTRSTWCRPCSTRWASSRRPPIRGVTQSPIEGVSFAHTFNDAKAGSQHKTQYFEMFAHRSIYHDGWRAVCPVSGPVLHGSGGRLRRDGAHRGKLRELDAKGWELYDLRRTPQRPTISPAAIATS